MNELINYLGQQGFACERSRGKVYCTKDKWDIIISPKEELITLKWSDEKTADQWYWNDHYTQHYTFGFTTEEMELINEFLRNVQPVTHYPIKRSKRIPKKVYAGSIEFEFTKTFHFNEINKFKKYVELLCSKYINPSVEITFEVYPSS